MHSSAILSHKLRRKKEKQISIHSRKEASNQHLQSGAHTAV